MFIVLASFHESGTHTFKHADVSLIIYLQAKVARTYAVSTISLPSIHFHGLLSALGNECPCYSHVHTDRFSL